MKTLGWVGVAIFGAGAFGTTCAGAVHYESFRTPLGVLVLMLSLFLAVVGTVQALTPRLVEPTCIQRGTYPPPVIDEPTRVDVRAPLPQRQPPHVGDTSDATQVIAEPPTDSATNP